MRRKKPWEEKQRDARLSAVKQWLETLDSKPTSDGELPMLQWHRSGRAWVRGVRVIDGWEMEDDTLKAQLTDAPRLSSILKEEDIKVFQEWGKKHFAQT